MREIAPPSGAAPPAIFELADGHRLDLGPLAERLCDLYYDMHPDDAERYGPVGRTWCDHDSRYLLAWALEDARAGMVDVVAQVQWLGRILGARGFPVERLARHVVFAAAVLDTAGLGDLGTRAAERMKEAAEALRAAEAPPSPS